MSKRLSLPKILQKLYEEDSRYEVNPPIKIMKELEINALVIADMEISEEDIPILCKFFNHKEVLKRIERVQLYKSCGGKVNRRRTTSALSSNSHKLFRELLHLIAKCKRLHTVSFESIDIPIEILGHLGKALTITSSEIRWLGFHACTIGGDNGLQVLTPFLGRMRLQVLGLESCELTDHSIPYITSILKAHENFLDSEYWNATLRVDPTDDHGVQLEKETDHVYACGLVAFSLSGNKLTGKGILTLTRVLRKNYWLLGLNLADNLLDSDSLSVLIKSLQSNAILQALLLKGNPGLEHINSLKPFLREIIARNTGTVPASSTPLPLIGIAEDDEEGDLSKCNGPRRLRLLPEKVANVLTLWKRLQTMETNLLFKNTSSSFRFSKLQSGDDLENSFLTMSSIQSRKRYEKKAAEQLTKRKDVVGIAAAYSIFYFLDQESEQQPVTYKQNGYMSPPKQSSPTSASKQLNGFTTQTAVPNKSSFRSPSKSSDRYLGTEDVEDLHAFGDNDDELLLDPLYAAIPTPQSPPATTSSPHLRHSAAKINQKDTEAEVERMSWDNVRLWPSAVGLTSDAVYRDNSAFLPDERPPSRMSIRPSTERIVAGYDVPDMSRTNRPVSRQRSRKSTGTLEKQTSRPKSSYSQDLNRSSVRRSVSASSSTRGRLSSGNYDRQYDVLVSPIRGRSAVFGTAPRDTQISLNAALPHRTQVKQPESRRYYRDHGDARASTTRTSSTRRRRSTGRSSNVISGSALEDSHLLSSLDQHVKELTFSMQNATRNLEEASAKLQHASASLNESMLNMSSSQMNSFLLNSSGGHDWASSSAVKSRPVSASGGGDRGVASGIATHFHQRGGAMDTSGHDTNVWNGRNGHDDAKKSRVSTDGAALQDWDLAQLVRDKLYQRLEGLLEG